MRAGTGARYGKVSAQRQLGVQARDRVRSRPPISLPWPWLSVPSVVPTPLPCPCRSRVLRALTHSHFRARASSGLPPVASAVRAVASRRMGTVRHRTASHRLAWPDFRRAAALAWCAPLPLPHVGCASSALGELLPRRAAPHSRHRDARDEHLRGVAVGRRRRFGHVNATLTLACHEAFRQVSRASVACHVG